MPYVARLINLIRGRIYENTYLGQRPPKSATENDGLTNLPAIIVRLADQQRGLGADQANALSSKQTLLFFVLASADSNAQPAARRVRPWRAHSRAITTRQPGCVSRERMRLMLSCL